MIRSFLTSFYRSLARHPLYAALNLLGLSFGIAAFIVLVLFVRFETSYEQWLPGAGSIYEVATLRVANGVVQKRHFSSAGNTLDAIRSELPGVEGTRIASAYVVVRRGDKVYEEEGQLVDPEFFDIFDVDWVAGDPSTALRPGAVILSERLALKYFDRTDVVGRYLVLRDDIGPSTRVPLPSRAYIVSGVVKNPPANSALHFDVIRLLTPAQKADTPYWNDWVATRHHTYLRLRNSQAVAKMAARLDHIIDTQGQAAHYDSLAPGQTRHTLIRLALVPLTSEHLAERKAVAGVWLLGVVGMLALWVALINYINLATARAGLRAREVAVRKAMGATVGQIRRQFLTEAALVSLAAALLGFSLVELLLPLVNAFGGLSLRLDYVREAPLLLALAAAVVLSGLLAGLYPAVVLSGFEPAHVLSSSRSPSGGKLGRLLREGLAVLQFAVVSILFVVVTGFAVQLQHMATSDLGFSRSGLLITNSTLSTFLNQAQVETIRDRWRALPDVVSVTTGTVPGRYFQYGGLSLSLPAAPLHVVEVRSLFIENDFFRTYDTAVLAGRALRTTDAAAYDQILGKGGGIINVDLNLEAVRALGFTSPEAAIGQVAGFEKSQLRIVGVVENQRFASPTEAIGPIVYIISVTTASDSSTILRFANVPEAVMRARMDAVWRGVAPDLPLQIQSGATVLESYYEADRRNTSLFAIGAVVAGLVGAIGLYGMAAFNTSNRAREIGLRKVMGASRGRVAALLVLQFLRPVAIANLLAWPVAWLTLSQWLSQFDDRTLMRAWFFAAGSGISLLVAVVTVASLALSAASSAPGKALRRE